MANKDKNLTFTFYKLKPKVWWPGELINPDTAPPSKLTQDMREALEKLKEKKNKKKSEFARIVKWPRFEEEGFELVTDEACLKPYVSEEKEELIKKGAEYLGLKSKALENYKHDIVHVETLLGHRTRELSTVWFDKLVYKGDGGKKGNNNTPKGSLVKELFSKEPEETPPKRSRGVIIGSPSSSSPRKNREKKEIVVDTPPPTVDTNKKFRCQQCDARYDRISVLYMHTKDCKGKPVGGMTMTPSTPSPKKSPKAKPPAALSPAKKAKTSPTVVAAASASTTPVTPSRKRRGRPAGKKAKLMEEEKLREEVLKDWGDDEEENDDDEEMEEEKMPELRIFETHNTEELELKPPEITGKKEEVVSSVDLFDRLLGKKNEKPEEKKVEEEEVKDDKEDEDKSKENEDQDLVTTEEGEKKQGNESELEQEETEPEVPEPALDTTTESESENENNTMVDMIGLVGETGKDEDSKSMDMEEEVEESGEKVEQEEEKMEEEINDETEKAMDEEENKDPDPIITDQCESMEQSGMEKEQEEEEQPEDQETPLETEPESESLSPVETKNKKPTATIRPTTTTTSPQSQSQPPPQLELEKQGQQQQQQQQIILPANLIESDAIVHLVPVENADGSVSYILVSSSPTGNGEVRVNVGQGGSGGLDPQLTGMEAIFVDDPKGLDLASVIGAGVPAPSTSKPDEGN